MTDYQVVLDYWLGDAALSPEHAKRRKKLWYRSNPDTDNEIRTNFSALYEQGIRGDLSEWRKTADGSLALVILLDQFSRHLHRAEPGAFAQDRLALEIAESCPHPDSLPLIAQAFLYHPYQHSEQLDVQKRSLKLFKALAETCDLLWQPMMENFYHHAKEHHDIVARFGRFPHRNKILGRDNTEEELAYLAQNPRSFGQGKK